MLQLCCHNDWCTSHYANWKNWDMWKHSNEWYCLWKLMILYSHSTSVWQYNITFSDNYVNNIWLSFLIFELQFFHDLLSEDSFERDYGTHQTKVPFSSTGQGNEWKELTFFMNNVYSYGSFDTLTFPNKNVITY